MPHYDKVNWDKFLWDKIHCPKMRICLFKVFLIVSQLNITSDAYTSMMICECYVIKTRKASIIFFSTVPILLIYGAGADLIRTSSMQ